MAWSAIFEQATGRLVSTGTVVASDAVLAANGQAKLDVPFNPQVQTKRWNEATRVFDDVTPPKGKLSTDELIDRMTQTEWEAVSIAARKHANENVRDQITAFMEYLRSRKAVDLEDPYVAGSFARMETTGIIGAGRAATLLSARVR